MGITPRQESTGGKTRLPGISKAGDGYLRRLPSTHERQALTEEPGSKPMNI
jgi:transposase